MNQARDALIVPTICVDDYDMAESASAGSPTPVETNETSAQSAEQAGNSVSPEQWAAMKRVIEKVYTHREAEYANHPLCRAILTFLVVTIRRSSFTAKSINEWCLTITMSSRSLSR